MLRRVEGTVTSADGTRLAVRRVGAGDPVVLLHGTGGGLHSWAGVADLLAADHRVWLVARRGYAPSDVPAGVNSFDREVADVHAVLSAVGDEDGAPAHLVGASYGATLALHAVRDAVPGHPQAARSLALYEPPLFASGPPMDLRSASRIRGSSIFRGTKRGSSANTGRRGRRNIISPICRPKRICAR